MTRDAAGFLLKTAPYKCCLWFFLFWLWGAGNVLAHDARPVYVQIAEQGGDRYQVFWKVPVSAPAYAIPQPHMPATCRPLEPPIRGHTGDGYTFQQTHECAGEFPGSEVGIDFPNNNPGLSTLIRLTLLGGETHSRILKPGKTRWQIPERKNSSGIALDYTLLGVEHIFLGIDHLLFVACLVFIAATFRRILITVTGFTIAHSLTLALSALELVNLPVPPVEAAIALSIVFLAHEIAVGNRNSWTWRYPLLVSSSFGLLHGFGFASVLRDIGLPQTERAAGLLFFNVGVEIGQVMFILVLLVAAALSCRYFSIHRTSLLAHRQVSVPGSYAIGIIASYWLIQRLAGFTA